MELSGRRATVDDPMHRCPADAERAGNVAWSPIIRRHRFDLGDQLWRQRLTAFVLALGLGFGDAFALPLKHHRALELGNRPEDIEHQLAGRRRGIHAHGQDAQRRPLHLDRTDDLRQVRHIAGEVKQ